jgi:hypothetical protein
LIPLGAILLLVEREREREREREEAGNCTGAKKGHK